MCPVVGQLSLYKEWHSCRNGNREHSCLRAVACLSSGYEPIFTLPLRARTVKGFLSFRCCPKVLTAFRQAQQKERQDCPKVLTALRQAQQKERQVSNSVRSRRIAETDCGQIEGSTNPSVVSLLAVNRSRSTSPGNRVFKRRKTSPSEGNRVSKKTKTSPSDIKKSARDQVSQKSAKLAKSAKPTKTKLLNFAPTGLKHRVVYTEEAVPKANSELIVSSTPIRNLGPKTTAYNLQALANLPGKGSAAVKRAVSRSLTSSKAGLTSYTATHKATSSRRPASKPAATPAAKAAAAATPAVRARAAVTAQAVKQYSAAEAGVDFEVLQAQAAGRAAQKRVLEIKHKQLPTCSGWLQCSEAEYAQTMQIVPWSLVMSELYMSVAFLAFSGLHFTVCGPVC
ncbi:hypothetical protein COO60DRAFT_1491164 [Scenedesmus sp. NREL 46B-D3]|nr:hypothetical protein COO60DRAFT_1491164 [Scenedesmus sp. NREL 46B-D3]